MILNTSGSPDLITRVSTSGATDICSLNFDDNWPAADLEFGPEGTLYLSDSPRNRILKIGFPAPTINDIVDLVKSFNIKQGIENSFDAKLQNALAALDAANAGYVTVACNLLDAFLSDVHAQSGKALTVVQSNQLMDITNQIKTGLGCH